MRVCALSAANMARPSAMAFGFGTVNGYTVLGAFFCPCTRMVMINMCVGVKCNAVRHCGTTHYDTNHGNNQFFHFLPL